MSGEVATARSRDRFFISMAVSLLLLLVAGFIPTLFLRGAFEVPPIPGYLHVHGALMTSWFVWIVVQTSLIAQSRTDVHRRIGLFGLLIGAGVVVGGLMATLNVVSRLVEMGVDLDELMFFASWVVWGNFASLVAFSIFVGTAIVFRTKPETHKRLMLLATLSIIGPVLARIALWPIFASWIDEISFVTAGSLILLAVVVVHDVVKNSRVQRVTAVGASYAVANVFAPLAISTTGIGNSLIRALA